MERPPDLTTDRDVAFRSVVLGTDFSESAQLAGRYASLFARHFHATCLVAHAFTLVQPALEVEALESVWSEQRKDLQRLLSQTLHDLAPWAGRMKSLLAEGSPIELIRAAAEESGPSLVVLGTHGGGAFKQHMMGSVAEVILRTLACPILTVGPHVPAPSPTALTLRRILFATDFSPAAAHAAPYVVLLAREFNSEIDVLHVVPDGEEDRRDKGTSQDRGFLDVLRRLLPHDAERLCKSRTFVESGRVRDRILQHASEGVDLIVMGAHHRSWFARHLRTGPAFQIILGAACPVLTTTANRDAEGNYP